MKVFFFIGVILIVTIISSCFTGLKSKSGREAYELKQYSLAISLLLKEYEEKPSLGQRAVLAFKIGHSYEKMGLYSKSLIWYKRAYEYGHGLAALEKYAFSLKQNEDYEAAIGTFGLLGEESGTPQLYQREISICKLCIEWKKRAEWPVHYDVGLAEEINDYSNNFGAVYTKAGNLIFSSDRMGVTGKDKYQWSGNFYFDLFNYDPAKMSVQQLSTAINTKFNEGSCSIDQNEQLIYFTRCANTELTDYYCQIYEGSMGEDDKSEKIDLGGESCNNIHPAIHHSDSILIFSSDRINGFGQFDLYMAIKKEGEWNEPQNLGESINTQGNEKFPVWYKDTLYFCSDHLPGFGGLDIFKTWRMVNGKWSDPQHLDYPVNSGGDDLVFSRDPNFIPSDTVLERGVFTSNRSGIGDKIYQFTLLKKSSPQPVKVKKEVYKFRIYVNINFSRAEEYTSQLSNFPLDSVQIQMSNDPSDILFTGKKTNLILQLLPDTKYDIKASRRSCLNSVLTFTTPPVPVLDADSTITLNYLMALIPFELNKEFVLQDVYYDFDKWDLRPDALPAIDKLYESMIINPKIKIHIGSHTDCRGEENYNLELSRNRAKSVYQYLIDKGIFSDRLDYIGFGEREFAVSCECNLCSEEEHQMNRRSTFKISLLE
ncbi:MAG: OmpA family protein [Saprospiraceae bacterium]|nr:OmpA family protein [Candidatus Vicinibacter affinis]